MAARMITGAPGTLAKDLVSSDLVGTETVTVAVAAGKISIIIDAGVDLKQSGIIDALINKMADVLREAQYA